MKILKGKELLQKAETFKNLLREHRDLWEKSLDDTIPDHPMRNKGKLEEQQIELFKLFYQIDEYLTMFSKDRIMHHPATGMKWDVYKSAIGNDVAPIKGPSLKSALLELTGIIAVLEEEDSEKEISVNYVSVGPKRIFVSHGNETQALIKLERFLRGLGLTPIIVKDEPSLGKSLDDLIDEQMGTCMAVIILATKDDKVKDEGGKEYYQPRPNVIHEIGLAQEKVKDRIIYLKEKGCIFPSNISPKVWEIFTQDNMESAYLKVVKELKGFRIVG